MHAMSICLKDTDRSLYFPRVITQLLEKKGSPMKESKNYKIMSMESKSFRCWYGNYFQPVDEIAKGYILGLLEMFALVSIIEKNLLNFNIPNRWAHRSSNNAGEESWKCWERHRNGSKEGEESKENVSLMHDNVKTNFKNIMVSIEKSRWA